MDAKDRETDEMATGVMTPIAALRNTNALSGMNCNATAAASTSVSSTAGKSAGALGLLGDKTKHSRVGRQFVGLRNATPNVDHAKQRTAFSAHGAIGSQVRHLKLKSDWKKC